MALAYENISFRLINNGNVLFSTSGDGNRLGIISRVFPNIDVSSLTELNYQSGYFDVKGYVSVPSMSKTTRHSQIFFVNGRVVNSKVIDRGVSEGYRERLFEGRYPVVFLFLNLNSSDLDVNIHPNKKEVRFNHEKDVEDFISEAIKGALHTKDSVARASINSVPNIFSFDSDSFKEELPKYQPKETQFDIKNIMSTVTEQVEEEITPTLEVPPMPEPKMNVALDTDLNVGLAIDFHIEKPVLKPFDFDDLIVKGVIFDTYILATDADSFYMIDQHAAHERIFYEKLVSEYENGEKLRQPMFVPILINVDISTKIQDSDWLDILSKMGFAIEAFGQNSYRVSEIPTFMEISEAEDFLKDFTDGINDSFSRRNTVVINKLIMKSCKSAVKANDKLAPEEIAALIKDLKNCTNPFSCPHGRPTFIKLSKYEIERLFKRA
jgi:DNA mismatch repair protein MutL